MGAGIRGASLREKHARQAKAGPSLGRVHEEGDPDGRTTIQKAEGNCAEGQRATRYCFTDARDGEAGEPRLAAIDAIVSQAANVASRADILGYMGTLTSITTHICLLPRYTRLLACTFNDACSGRGVSLSFIERDKIQLNSLIRSVYQKEVLHSLNRIYRALQPIVLNLRNQLP